MSDNPVPAATECSTIEAARLLGLAVRSVQLMVDRGELHAWKTPGGHRRIARASVDAWLAARAGAAGAAQEPAATGGVADLTSSGTRPAQPTQRNQGTPSAQAARAVRLLLIEDSAHYQNLISLLVRQALPDADFMVASDGIAGLALAGREEPDVLIIDILLPGIDGATLITSLRSQEPFRKSTLIVVTSLDAQQREAYAFALQGLPVIHKSRLVAELPLQLARWKRADSGA